MDPNPHKTLRQHINFLDIELKKLRRREKDLLLKRDMLKDIESFDPIEEVREAAAAFKKEEWTAWGRPNQ